MKFGLFAASIALLTCLAGTANGRSQTPLPSTPAGQVMANFLSAFNSADSDRIGDYVKRYDGTSSLDELLAFSSSTGGFQVVSVLSSTPDQLKVLFKGCKDNVLSFADLRLTSTPPERVDRFIIRALPAGASIDDAPLTQTTRRQTLRELENDLERNYVDPVMARLMVDKLQKEQRVGAYDAISDGDEFAAALTSDLIAISHDHHLFVAYSPATSPDGNAAAVPGPAEVARYRGPRKRDNCSFSEVRILPRNIGYLKFDEFADAEECGPTVVSAMGFLAHADALIVDLRDNHGGQPAMVQLILSYFFGDRTHLNDIYFRPEDATQQYWTLPYVPGARLPNIPLYVLTSMRTFSGAEEFTNDLKAQKRATIIGKRTRGGAHPLSAIPIGNHFVAGIPIGRPINPITHTDWEGTGIAPDVEASATNALTVAQKLATDRLISESQRH